jgi:hypothetical protein
MTIFLAILSALRSFVPTGREQQPAQPPPITAATSLRLIEHRAILAEGFDSGCWTRAAGACGKRTRIEPVSCSHTRG